MKALDQTIGCRMVCSRSHAGITQQILQIMVEHVGLELSSLVGRFPWWSAKRTSKFPGSSGHIAQFPLPCSKGVQLAGNSVDTVKAVSESRNRQRIGMGRCGYGQTVKRATRNLQQVSDCGAWLWTSKCHQSEGPHPAVRFYGRPFSFFWHPTDCSIHSALVEAINTVKWLGGIFFNAGQEIRCRKILINWDKGTVTHSNFW